MRAETLCIYIHPSSPGSRTNKWFSNLFIYLFIIYLFIPHDSKGGLPSTEKEETWKRNQKKSHVMRRWKFTLSP